MKKMMIAASILFAGTVSAQSIKTNAGTFSKPSAGDILMELNYNPDITGGGAAFSYQPITGGLAGIKARKFKSDKKATRYVANLSVANSGAPGADTDFGVGFGIGIENHMKGAERLSTYWGYEGRVGFMADNNAAGVRETSLGLTAAVLTGFDYYVVPNVYLGAECNYGLSVSSVKPENADGVTSFGIAPGLNVSMRLGWRF